jgi:hypothetical protein
VARTVDAVALNLNITLPPQVHQQDKWWKEIVALAVTIIIHSGLPPDFKRFMELIMLEPAACFYVRWMVLSHLWRTEVSRKDTLQQRYSTIHHALTDIKSIQCRMSRMGISDPQPCMHWLQQKVCRYGAACYYSHIGDSASMPSARLNPAHVGTLRMFLHILGCTERSAEEVMLLAYTARREQYVAPSW